MAPTHQNENIQGHFTHYDRVTRVEVRAPSEDGVWKTEIDFHRKDTSEIDTIGFESSGRFINFYDLLMGFDSVAIEDRNRDGNTLEFGRFELQVHVDDHCTRCHVDCFYMVPHQRSHGESTFDSLPDLCKRRLKTGTEKGSE